MPLPNESMIALFDAIYRELQPHPAYSLPTIESLCETPASQVLQTLGYYNVQDPPTSEASPWDTGEDPESFDDEDAAPPGSGTPEPPRGAPDSYGWLVVQIPVLVEYLAKHGRLTSIKTSTDQTPQMTAHYRLVFGEQLRKYLLTYAVPPAAAVWRDTPRMRQLLQPLVANANDLVLEDWFIVRHTPLRVFRTGARNWSYPTLKTYQTAPGDIPRRTAQRLPEYMQLLLLALTEARGATDAYEKWGLAWVSRGLYFHHRRALRTAQRSDDLKSRFPGNDWEYFAQWEDPAYHEEKTPYVDLQRSCIISDAGIFTGGSIYTDLRPYDRIHGPKLLTHETSGAASYWSPMYARVFHTLPNRADTLHTYLERLLQIAATPDENLVLRRTGAKSGGIPRYSGQLHDTLLRTKRAKETRIVNAHDPAEITKPLTFCLSTVELGWMSEFEEDFTDPYWQKLRVCIRKEGEYYLAVPDDIASAFPELIAKECYALRDKVETEVSLGGTTFKSYVVVYTDPITKIRYDLTPVTRLKRDAHAKRYITKNYSAGVPNTPRQEVMYLHKDMFRYPDGEFWQIHHLIANTPDRDGRRDKRTLKYKGLLTCFAQFCMWLQAPSETRDAAQKQVVVGDELRFLTDPASTCPIKALTPEARLDFLYAKAECLTAPDVRGNPSPGKSGERAPRFNDYDEWVMWYARTVEIPKLDLRFTRNQYAEYMCKRWMPWRRPLSLSRKLIKPAYDTYEKRAPNADTGLDVDQLIAKAEAAVGFAYSAL